MTDDASEIRWSPRVPKRKIRRLYESEARGLLDEELLDDVGVWLYLRCESILAVSDAIRGEVHCPRCRNAGRRSIIRRGSSRAEEPLECPSCSWRATWGEYQATFRKRQLFEGGAGVYFRTFLEAYGRARTPRDKMLAIDRVIHEFHYNTVRNVRRPTRAACVNLIEGRLKDVVAFLHELSASVGDHAAPDLRRTRSRWARTLRSMSAKQSG